MCAEVNSRPLWRANRSRSTQEFSSHAFRDTRILTSLRLVEQQQDIFVHGDAGANDQHDQVIVALVRDAIAANRWATRSGLPGQKYRPPEASRCQAISS